MAHRKLVENERRELEFCIGPQLQKSENVIIETAGKPCNMNYCILNKGKSFFKQDAIVLLTGFGSGYPGIALLGSELAEMDYEVAMPSLLGYGNSDNPPIYHKHDFLCEAVALHLWASKVLPGKRIHWVGHSMASAIIVELAKISPDKVASVTLLDPVGFHKRSMLELGIKFVTNGWNHCKDFSGDPKLEIISKHLPKQKSAYSRDRIRQRISEWKRLSKDTALESLRKVVYEKPIRCIYGEKDTVARFVIDCDGMQYVTIPGLWHNTTMYGSDETANEINRFLIGLIK